MRELALYGLVLLAALGESSAFVGLVVPGVGVLLGASVLAARGQAELSLVGAAASLGAIAGFGVSYHLGRFGGRWVARWGVRAQVALDRARHLFERYGSWAVFWGHFFGPVRAFVAFAAGAGGLAPRPFWTASILGGAAWGYGLTAAGALLSGGWALVEAHLGRGSVFIALVAGLLYLALRVAAGTLNLGLRLLPSATRPFLALLESARRRGSETARGSPLVDWLHRRLSPDHATGLALSVGALACAGFAWVFFDVVENLLFHDSIIEADQRFFHLVQALRSPAGDRFFLAVTYVASGPVLVCTAAAAACTLLAVGRQFEALLVAGGFGAGEVLLWALKRGVDRPRPAPVLPLVADAGSAFPSNHAFSSLALYGMLTYLAGRGLRSAAARGSLYASLGVLVLAVGLGRLYLGAHWLSDVAGGYALGAIWLTALVTAAEVHRRSSEAPPIPSRHRNLAPFTVAVALLAAWGVVTAWQMPRDLSRRSESTPRRSIPAAAVVEEVRSLAAWPVETLLGEPRGAFGLALVGPEPVVRDAARAAGWGVAEPLQPGSLLPRLLRAFRGESDPLAPPYPFFWQARPQDLALTRPADRGRWVVRLWRSGITVVGIGDIWVAWLRFEPPPSRFLGIPLPALGSGAEAPWPALRDALAATGRLRPFPSGPGPAVLFAPSPFPEPR